MDEFERFLEDWEREYFGPWRFIPRDSLTAETDELKTRYPERNLIPFAKKQGYGDIACFESKNDRKVIVLYTETASGKESVRTFDDFWAWMHFAADEIKTDCDRFARCSSCPYHADSKSFKQDAGIYPAAYLCLLARHLYDFGVWYLLPETLIQPKALGLKERYKRSLLPFAAREDRDDYACFEPGSGSAVNIIHDYASPGWEQRGKLDNFWAWLHFAVDETK